MSERSVDSTFETVNPNTDFEELLIVLEFRFSLSLNLCIREGNGTPLQYSCLDNPIDGGACRAAIYEVTQSQIRLKRLSSSSSSNLCIQI